MQKENIMAIDELIKKVDTLKIRKENAKNEQEVIEIMAEYFSLIENYHCVNETITWKQLDKLREILDEE